VLIGVLGGGQLGRMLALAGLPLGLRFRFLDPVADSPARDVGELVVGEFTDPAAVARFAAGLDAATFEFENVPLEAARAVAARVPMYPPLAALEAGQDRLHEKELFRRSGLAVHDYAPASSEAELAGAVSRLGLPLVAKTRRMGYDGKGQMVLRTPADAAACWQRLGGVPLLVERLVEFRRELSVIACRDRAGRIEFYPLTQNVHEQGILRTSRAPAPDVPGAVEAAAAGHVRTLMDALGYVGVLAVELFDTGSALLANEMAPRVHNTGHWTIDAAATSQFENHCRAIAGLPLGPAGPVRPAVMVNLIGHLPDPATVLAIPGARLHLYGKAVRPGRKVGHVTITGREGPELEEAAGRVMALSPRC
jgi:5-(carboxyamino)imidazole ribonucleotide synthase